MIIKEQNLATKDDISGIRGDLGVLRDETKKIQKEHDDRMDSIERTMAEMREEMRESKGTRGVVVGGGTPSISTTGSSVGPSASAAGGRGQSSQDWQPGTVFVRGFAPYGCTPLEKLAKAEALVFQEKLLACLPSHVRGATRAGVPFAINHQLAFSIQGGREKCAVVAQMFNDFISSTGLTVKGHTPRAAVEISEGRKMLCRNFFTATDALKAAGVSQEKFTTCAKGLRVYALPSYTEIGSTPAGTTSWKWNPTGCALVGYDLQLDAERAVL
jgi:hypothetical protein